MRMGEMGDKEQSMEVLLGNHNNSGVGGEVGSTSEVGDNIQAWPHLPAL